MSTILGPAHAARYPVEARQATQADAAIAAFEKARAAHPRLAAERAVLRTVADAVQPRDVSRRACFDADYGSFSDHWLDPRTEQDDEAMTPDQAEEEATGYILSHAESMADWLAKACDCEAGRNERNVSGVSPLRILHADPALLFAVVMTGANDQVLRAVHQLRELAARDFAAEIKAHAAVLLAEAA